MTLFKRLFIVTLVCSFALNSIATTHDNQESEWAGDYVFSLIRTMGQFEVIARLMLESKSDLDSFQEVTRNIDPSTPVSINRNNSTVHIRVGSEPTTTLELLDAVNGKVSLDGQILDIRGKTLRELIEDVKRDRNGEKARFLNLPLYFVTGESAQAVGQVAIAGAVIGLFYAQGMAASLGSCLGMSIADNHETASPSNATTTVLKCVAKAPFLLDLIALVKRRGKTELLNMTKFAVKCPTKKAPDLRLLYKGQTGSKKDFVRTFTVVLKDGKPVTLLHSEAMATVPGKDSPVERSSTSYPMNSNWQITKEFPFSEKMPSILESVAKQCALNPNDLAKLADIVNSAEAEKKKKKAAAAAKSLQVQ